jgi:hypothetical protein
MVLSITSGTPASCAIFDRLDVEHVHARIGDGLAIQGARLRGDRLAEILRVVGLDEFDVDAQTPEAHVELRVGAAVERAGRHQFVALPEQAGDRQELRRPWAAPRARPIQTAKEA